MHTGRKAGVFLLPFLAAAPIIAALMFAVLQFGPTILKLIHILIKMAVTA